jgi:hypothetical protein
VHGNFLVSFDSEAADGEPGSGGDGFLSGEIFEHFGGCVVVEIPLVSLSPDYPTEIFSTSFSILISRMGFSFSAWGFLATFLDIVDK